MVNSLSRAPSAQGSRTVGQRGHLQPKGSVAAELLGSAASRLHQSSLPSSGTAFHGKAGECLTARCYPCPGGTARVEMILLTEDQRARAAFLILTSGGPAIRTTSAKHGRKAFEGAIRKWREDQRVFGPDVVEAAFGGGGRAPQADAARHSRAVHPGAATGVMTCRIGTDNPDAQPR